MISKLLCYVALFDNVMVGSDSYQNSLSVLDTRVAWVVEADLICAVINNWY